MKVPWYDTVPISCAEVCKELVGVFIQYLRVPGSVHMCILRICEVQTYP